MSVYGDLTNLTIVPRDYKVDDVTVSQSVPPYERTAVAISDLSYLSTRCLILVLSELSLMNSI
jgi:hypothetical protein